MSQSISGLIYEAFFERLAMRPDVKPETIQALKDLYVNNQITNKTRLAQLAQEMEFRHAEDQNTDRP